MGKRVVAFEFGNRYIKVMEFIPTFRGPKVIRLKYSTISSKKDWKKEASNFIRKAIIKCKKSNIEVISSLHSHLFFIRNYFFPFSNIAKIRKVVRFEMEGDIPLPIQDVLVDSLFLSKKEKGAEVIAFALPRSTLNKYMELFPKDSRPHIVVPDLVALSCLGPHKKSGIYGVFEIGIDKVAMAVVSQRRLKIGRTIPSDINRGPNITNEMKTTLDDWRKKGIEINRAYFLGDGIKELDIESLRSNLKIQLIHVPTPGPLKKSKTAQFFISLAGLASSFMEVDFNILRTDKEENEKEAKRKKIIAFTVCICILFILGIGDISLRYYLLSKQYQVYKKRGVDIFHKFLPDIKKVVNERIQLKTALKENKKRVELLKAGKIVVFKPARFIDMLHKEANRNGILLVAVSVEEDGIIFEGETSNSNSIGPFMRNVKKHERVIEAVVQRMDSRAKSIRFKGKLKIASVVSFK